MSGSRSLLFCIAQLRHVYAKLKAGNVVDQPQLADGIIASVIEYLEGLWLAPGQLNDGPALPPMPPTNDRQPHIDVLGNDSGYLEGDGDWAIDNADAITWLIDNHAAIRARLKDTA